MAHTKPKRRRRSKALPVLGAAGLSLSLASGASAVPAGPASPTQNTTEVGQNITLGEEEIGDVSLATFYVFDKENDGISGPLQLVGHGGHGHGGGCGGHGHGGGCGGCGGHGRGCGGCGGHHGHGCGGCGGHHGFGGCGGCIGIGIGCGGCGGCYGGYWCWINGVRTWCPYGYGY
jgi:hypothetical protein